MDHLENGNTVGNIRTTRELTDGDSGKRCYRSGSFRGVLSTDRVKKIKLDKTSETGDLYKPENNADIYNDNDRISLTGSSDEINRNKTGIGKQDTSKLTKKPSARKSLRDNFLELSGSKNDASHTLLSRTASATGSLRPLPVIKSVQSDSAVGTSTFRSQCHDNTVHRDQLQPRTMADSSLHSPLPALDAMFGVAKFPVHIQTTPALKQRQQLHDVLQSPNISKQLNSLSLYDSTSKQSPQVEKKNSRATLSRKKRNCSSTSRFRGTPLKTKLTPLITKETKSCSALGEQEFSNSPSTGIRIGTPYKIHSTPIHSMQPAYELDTGLKKEYKLTPKKTSVLSSGTPIKTVSKLLSKLRTPKRQNIVGPQEDLFF